MCISNKLVELANKKGSVGGIFLLINERWCSSSTVISKFCSHDLESILIECKPFFSPREFASIIMVSAYITDNKPESITALASQNVIIQNSHPDSLLLIFGDFNQTFLTKELPKYTNNK